MLIAWLLLADSPNTGETSIVIAVVSAVLAAASSAFSAWLKLQSDKIQREYNEDRAKDKETIRRLEDSNSWQRVQIEELKAREKDSKLEREQERQEWRRERDQLQEQINRCTESHAAIAARFAKQSDELTELRRLVKG